MTHEIINTTIESEKSKIGLSIIPVSSQKIPFKQWTEYQSIECPISEWYTYYQKQGNVGIICGKISGNLEVIDIDEKNDPDHSITKEYLSLIPDELQNRLIKPPEKIISNKSWFQLINK